MVRGRFITTMLGQIATVRIHVPQLLRDVHREVRLDDLNDQHPRAFQLFRFRGKPIERCRDYFIVFLEWVVFRAKTVCAFGCAKTNCERIMLNE